MTDTEVYPFAGEGAAQLWGVWSAVSSFRVGLSYRVAWAELTSFLGQLTPEDKGQAISVLRETLMSNLCSAQVHWVFWGLHCNVTSFAQIAFPYSLHIFGSLIKLLLPKLYLSLSFQRTLPLTLPDLLRVDYSHFLPVSLS